MKNIQAGELQIAIAGPSFLQSEIISIENMLPLSGSSVEINSPAFSTGLTELDKQQELSEISMYLDISGMVASSHEMAMLSILNSMLTGIKDSLLGHKLRTQKQWIYSIVSYPIFYSNMTLLKIVTITPTIYKKKLIKTLENNLVNESDLSDELLFYKAKKRVINELYINCEVNKNEYLKTIC
ncbi:TPA: insulinase family protein, partial [Streptococcus pneumoniae]|nr:insulinase family protein [Streptococcus pneumoniae]